MPLKLQSNPAVHIPLSEVGAIPPPSAYSMGSMCARAGVKDAKQPKVLSLTPARHMLSVIWPTRVPDELPTRNSEEPKKILTHPKCS